MTDSLAMRGANAATGFVLSSLLVCGVIVVSDTGTYSLPIIDQNIPLAEDIPPHPPTGPTSDAQRASLRQTIIVPVTLRSPRKANGRGGAAMALPATPARPDQRQEAGQRGDPRPGRGSFTTGASHDRPERGQPGPRTSSRHSATSARNAAPARSAFRPSARGSSGRGS